jgi:hypothetical protein
MFAFHKTLLPIAFSACLFATAVPSAAADIDDAQLVIEDQINAFLMDDAEAAYSHAAPGIRALYPDSGRFFEMVKRGYRPVYRADNFAFGRWKASEDGRTIYQEVLVEGPDRKDWRVLYRLDKQEDGIFKINGVQMAKTDAPQI